MTQNNLITIVTMWNKVNELSRENLSQQQIAIMRLLGVEAKNVGGDTGYAGTENRDECKAD